uniref:class I ribonucleotide reductase maintenance protein YfaE n=1 Tax=Thaumasiovibrio occultus TaxID=1891184 RepID=UPI000B356388|nr:class I ribonucleotide reductase maintenance protein YfaE [Thaumasiovibrio occultus]
MVYLDATHNPNATLLQHLALQGLEAESQCRDGFCGACKCKLVEGDVEYTQTALAFVMPDEVLPCICKPLTNLKITQITYHIKS